MTPTESQKVIDAAGGDSAFAKLLGIDQSPGFQQRVNNWRRRGIPSDVVLGHYDTINSLVIAAKKKPSPSKAAG